MSDELTTILLATLIGLLPNLVIKWVEKQKPKEELDKTSLETADISLEMMKDTNTALSQHIKFLDERLEYKKEEIRVLVDKIKQLEDEIQKLKGEKEA